MSEPAPHHPSGRAALVVALVSVAVIVLAMLSTIGH